MFDDLKSINVFSDGRCSRMMGVSNARIALCLPASCENDKVDF